MAKNIKWFIGLLTLLLSPVQAEELPVMVSILPLQYFVAQIGEDRVRVNVLVGPGQSPATYEPTPGRMRELTAARVYFAVGELPFERAWGERIRAASPNLRWVNTSPEMAEDGHSPPLPSGHDHEHHHHDHGLDPHIWVSPTQAKIMATRIAETLAQVDPARASAYQTAAMVWQQKLDRLHQEIQTQLEPLSARNFMVFHPAWGHFAATYDLHQIAIEVEGKEPGPRTLARLIDQGRAMNIPVIFVQSQFSRKTAEAVAREISAQVVDADPLAYDYEQNLRAVARAFAEALR